jgi:acetyl-CoA carboxylase biotin carboxylase subunit
VQVEHPVTELVTGIDIVKTQLRIAAGEPLEFSQKDIAWRGHALECRINAEDAKTFRPSPGIVTLFHPPGGPGVRLDTHLYHGYQVPRYYDSMIGKLITHGDTREVAIARMQNALNEIVIDGIQTNLDLHRELLEDEAFRRGGVDIHFLEKRLGIP